jgi:hypothetical protein
MTIPRSRAQKSIYFLLQKSLRQKRRKYKINHNKRFIQYLCAKFCTGPTHDITHNISKIQLMNMCGFGSTTDLGKMDFNFSCKNRNSKVYTSFAKVVGLVTRSTEKLILHF